MRKIFQTPKLPAPKGPYSQAVWAGNLLFLSGLLGVNPTTGEVASDMAGQTRQALENLRVLLEEAGGSLANVVKTTVFLANAEDFKKMNEVYAEFFPENPPARSTLQAQPPGGFLVEIEAVAYFSETGY
jgi:2-iminobutanoate/2-iminopropanoate deaminase